MRNSLLLLTLLPVVPVHAQTTLKSAREVLSTQEKPPEQMEVASESTSYPPGTRAASWMADLRRLQGTGRNTSAYARQWVALAQRREALGKLKGGSQPDYRLLVRAMPEPSLWPELLRVARADFLRTPKLENAVPYYFTAKLNNAKSDQVQALRALYRALAPNAQAITALKPESGQPSQFARENELRRSAQQLKYLCGLLEDSPSRAQRAAGVDLRLAIAPGLSYETYEVPDLVADFGEKGATPLVKRILQSKINLTWYGAGVTADLARRLWLSDTELQKNPHFNLVNSVKDWKFARRLLELHGTKPLQGQIIYNVGSAQSYVISGLLQENRTAEASRLIEKWIDNPKQYDNIHFPYLDQDAPREMQVRQLRFVEAEMRKHPQLDWGGGYTVLAQRFGLTTTRLNSLKKAVFQPGFAKLDRARRHSAFKSLADAYLAEGDVKNGGLALVKSLQVAASDWQELVGDTEALLRLNRAAPSPVLMTAARSGATRLFATSASFKNHYRAADAATSIATRMAEQKQLVFAQSLLVRALNATTQRDKSDYWDPDNSEKRSYLYGLMEIYHRANRPADMIYLLENATGWGEKELTPLLTFDGGDDWSYEVENPETKSLPKLGYLAAWALARTNRNADAVRVVKALIDRAPGYDSAYQLLCNLQGEAARPYLRQLAARDRFEERPLIWQAALSRRAKDWKAAEQLAKQAIAIDPSDGEEGPGDRLRAYAELAAAQKGAGNVAQANELEKAVSAIRLAERADYFRIAGLTNQAIEMYKQSLGYFDNAYCVQSRLAVQLFGEGRYAEASGHFRRAYELMPVSFGRLESHCFGCEGVFGGKLQNSIAKEVFLQLEKARPNDPKIAYLSGYWRSTAGEDKAATSYFRRAVQLDPLYLSAWLKLRSSQYLTPLQQDQAVLQLIKLDPRGFHQGSYNEGVSFHVKQDYKGLWTTTEQVLARKNVASTARFPLPKVVRSGYQSYSTWDLVKKPGDAIAYQPKVRGLFQILAKESE